MKYLINFAVFIILIFTLYNLYLYTKAQNNVKVIPINYFQNCVETNGYEFPSTNSSKLDDLIKNLSCTVVIILSNSSCHPCQITALKDLEKINFPNIYGIYAGENIMEIKLFKRISKFSHPVIPVKPAVFKNTIFKKYPVILLLKKGVIVNSFYPDINFPDLDDWFYKYLISLTTGIVDKGNYLNYK